jgi:pimeloyl-ACP methyl ester carboxylesterase
MSASPPLAEVPAATSVDDGGVRADRFAYLHGFASGPGSRKGGRLAGAFRRHGGTFHLPDLNVPSFAELTYAGMLRGVGALDAAHGDAARPGRWGFVGSSMGGWVAARWAELHPDRVARLLLLAPGFDLASRWRDLISPSQLEDWERTGWIEAKDGAGKPTRLHWGFMEDARRQPPFPGPACPTLVLHGRRDTVVPVAVSERWAEQRPNVELEVLDDDHDLLATLAHIEHRALSWFGLAG